MSGFFKYAPVLMLCLLITACSTVPPELGVPDGSTTGTSTNASTGNSGGAHTLSGTIQPGQAAKAHARMADETYPYTVVVQSDQSGKLYRAETDPNGAFNLALPESETGNTITTTLLGPDGRVVGPVVLGQSGGNGIMGAALDHDASLGTIELPDDPTKTAIVPGSDANVTDILDPTVTARLSSDGAPVGLASHGKGSAAEAPTERPGAKADADGDGLIDVFDADDNGNGVVDDFDPTTAAHIAAAPDYHVNFFMNLKIGTDYAATYYTGTAAEVASRLSTDTVITFEVMTEPTATRSITAARLLETPGPAYLPHATKLAVGGGTAALWKDSGYAFGPETDRYDAFVVPNAVMDAGDTFTLEISFSDGTTEQVSRMINYVFKNIPRLTRYGSPASLADFDMGSTTVNGTQQHPILFDGTQDLVLVFQPPPDETGAPITGLDYGFQMFYNGSGGQLNGQIDEAATWPTRVVGTGTQGTTYTVLATELGTLSADGTYTATLPKGLFVDMVYLTGGGTSAVTDYKIDITAYCSSGNAAIMLSYSK